MSNTMIQSPTEHKAHIREVCAEGWTLAYPQWVRETFTKALLTPVLPQYAVQRVESALRAAVKINERMEKHADMVPAKDKVSAANHNARKADKRARDRELRMKMKSPKGSKS